jgi:succinate dehydrogenase / fumarate reductase cytochrome b subunit
MSATAVSVSSANLRFWQTTIGKKAVMAVTGVILFGFVVAHLLGNLQIYISAEKLNAYSAALHSMPALLWGARITLLVSVFLHIWASWQLWLLQRAARPIAYIKKVNEHSTYASRTMVWSGPIILAFVIFHLLHFTLGFSHPVYTPILRTAAKIVAILIAAGNISIPVAVLSGLIKPV